jgi:hypothetical protein
MAFVLQGTTPNALGGGGGSLGYQGIPNSLAIKFDLYNNEGEGVNSTGIFFNGDFPGLPHAPGEQSIDLTSSGIDLHSQDVFQINLTYDGTTLTETITDETLASHPMFTHSYTVNTPALIGGNVAYAGFTGGTGGLTTVADVQTWTYQFTQPRPGQPQLAADGPAANAEAPALTAVELAPVAQEAVANWAATGLSADQVAELNAVQYQIDTLGGGVLGLTDLGSEVVTLDATAAGYGWYLGSTPGDDSAFGIVTAPNELQASPGSPAFGRMDLLTVVEHELGHVLGLGDLNPQAVPHDVMTETLATGVRRSPGALFVTVTDGAQAPAAQSVGTTPPPLIDSSLVTANGTSAGSQEQSAATTPATSDVDLSLLLANGGALIGAAPGQALGPSDWPPSLPGPNAGVGLGASPIVLDTGNAADVGGLAVVPAKPDPGADVAALDQLFSSPEQWAGLGGY